MRTGEQKDDTTWQSMTSCTLSGMLPILLQSLMCTFHFLRCLQLLQSWRLCLRNLGRIFWHRFALISLWSLGQALGFLLRIPSQNLPSYAWKIDVLIPVPHLLNRLDICHIQCYCERSQSFTCVIFCEQHAGQRDTVNLG